LLGPPEESNEPGRLELKNNWDEDVEFTVLVDGEFRANITVSPGETINRPDFIDTTGEKNVTIKVVGVTTEFTVSMSERDGELTGPFIEMEVTQDGTVVGFID